MNSKPSILRALVAATALICAASTASAAVGNESSAVGTNSSVSMQTQMQAQTPASTAGLRIGSGAAVVMPAAAFAAGASAMAPNNNAVAFGEAAADGEEAIPAANMAVMLLAAIGAMGLVVVRRSGSR